MRCLFLSIVSSLLLVGQAEAQSIPNSGTPIVQGSIWTPTQWIAAFQSKQDYGGSGASLTGLTWGQIGSTPTTLGGYGITNGLATGNNLSDLASTTTARANLGLGTMATQNAGAVAVTGGSIAGVSVAATTLNVTGATGLQQAGQTILNVTGIGNGDGTSVAVGEGAVAGGGSTCESVGVGYWALHVASVTVCNNTTTTTAVGYMAGASSVNDGENAFFGWKAGASVNGQGEMACGGWNSCASLNGGSGFGTAWGNNTAGALIDGTSFVAVGTDVVRNALHWANFTFVGANAGKTYAGTNIALDMTGIGANVMFNWSGGGPGNHSAMTCGGTNSCYGAAGSTAYGIAAWGDQTGFSFTTAAYGTLAGSQAGMAVTSAQYFLALGYHVGNTTLTTGSDIGLIGTGAAGCDSNTSHTFTLCGGNGPFLQAAATNTSTPTTTLQGYLNVITGFAINGVNGASQTCTGGTTHTLIFTNGILTGGTCNT